MKLRANKYLLAIICGLFVSCTGNEVFSEFRSLRNSEWSRYETLHFDVAMTDTLCAYDVRLTIRNTNDYPYRNLWLFIEKENPRGEMMRDTLNVELADLYGKWHGKGLSLYALSLPYEEQTLFPDSGVYRYSIRQGMQSDRLTGISDVGLQVVPYP